MKDILKQAGLEESEIKVYLTLLESGPSSVSELTHKAGLTRTLGYHVLDKLGWYNLVERASGAGKKRYYIARHPKNLISLMNGKKRQLEKDIKNVSEELPKLTSLFRIADKPIVKYLDGVEGAKKIYEETLDSKSEILSILDLKPWYSNDLDLFKWGKEYTKERSKRKIKERVLVLDTKEGRDWMKFYQGSFKYTTHRWIKPEQVPSIKDFGGEMNIYENKVMMALFLKHYPIGILIESKSLADMLKAMFELAWHSGKNARIKKKK